MNEEKEDEVPSPGCCGVTADSGRGVDGKWPRSQLPLPFRGLPEMLVKAGVQPQRQAHEKQLQEYHQSSGEGESSGKGVLKATR